MIAEAGAEDPNEFKSNHKVFATLLPYVIRQERDGQPEMLDAFLHAARASGTSLIMWRHIYDFFCLLFREATPRAIVLVSPHIPWSLLAEREDLVQLWVAAASAVQYTEEVAQCVVDTLLRIASEEELLRYITVDVWSWLTKQPSLPPFGLGRFYGSDLHIVKAIRGLGDVEILKSYLLLTWSEWNALLSDVFDEMCASLREDFGGVGMGHHRVDLIQRLDQIPGRLDQGLGRLRRLNPNIMQRRSKRMKDQYGTLKDILLEVNLEAISRMSYSIIMLPCILTQADVHRVARNVYVCTSSVVPIAPFLEPSPSLIPPLPDFDTRVHS